MDLLSSRRGTEYTWNIAVSSSYSGLIDRCAPCVIGEDTGSSRAAELGLQRGVWDENRGDSEGHHVFSGPGRASSALTSAE
jgi:hypothetical protein